MAREPTSTLSVPVSRLTLTSSSLLAAYGALDLMSRDESDTHLDDASSHNFATAFLRNLCYSAVMSSNVWACQTVKNRLNYNKP